MLKRSATHVYREGAGQKLSQSKGSSDLVLDEAESVATTPKQGSRSPTDDHFDALFLGKSFESLCLFLRILL